MALVVVHPGLATTVQDGGRLGWRRFGVPPGGAADRGSLALANALLGNSPDASALELTLLGGSYRAEADLPLALAGAPMAAHVDAPDGSTRPWPIPGAATLHAGETLHLGGPANGARTYLAVREGWPTPIVLGSRSTETPLRSGDRLPAQAGSTPARWPSPRLAAEFAPPFERDRTLRFVAGTEIPGAGADPFGPFLVLDQSNRVGVRLDGPPIAVAPNPDRLSEPVVPGTIQVAGGRPIVLGVAGGTIGGYPVLGFVVAADLDALGQVRPGDRVRLQPVALAEARRLDADQRRRREVALARLAIAIGG